MSGVEVSHRTNPRFVPDGVSIRFGGGDDGTLGSDGTDLELLLAAAAKLMLGRQGAPSPDSLLHLHESSAGGVDAHSGAVAAVESDGDTALSLLAPDGQKPEVTFGFPSGQKRGGVRYYGPGLSPGDALALVVEAAERLRYSAGAFEFQEATEISTIAGDLTLNPAGRVMVSGGIEATGTWGTLIHQEEAPQDDTTTYDPKDDLSSPSVATWLVVVTAADNATGDPLGSGRYFSGLFLYVRTSGTTSDNHATELATVQGHGTAITASVDANGVITFGTTAAVSVRPDIIVRALRVS